MTDTELREELFSMFCAFSAEWSMLQDDHKSGKIDALHYGPAEQAILSNYKHKGMQLIQSDRKSLIERIEAKVVGEDLESRHVRVRKSTHGNCCQCQTCGENHDDCIMQNSMDEDELRAKQRQALERIKKEIGE